MNRNWGCAGFTEWAQEIEQVTSLEDPNFQVQEAYAQVVESRQGVDLFLKSILPAAEQNIRAAQTSYLTGKIPFLSLVEAQRSLIMLRDQYYESISDYFRRLATLERVIGGPIGLTAPSNMPAALATPPSK